MLSHEDIVKKILFWQSKTPVISVCPIQITLQL